VRITSIHHSHAVGANAEETRIDRVVLGGGGVATVTTVPAVGSPDPERPRQPVRIRNGASAADGAAGR
jgi:hypothetical protein